MKLFLLEDPDLLTQFARFSHLGTWSKGKLCEGCGQSTSRLKEPLQIAWEPDSGVIADFSWCAYAAVVTRRVADSLSELDFEFDLGAVQVVEPRRKGRKKRVPYPYKGPELKWLLPSSRISLDPSGSGIELLIDCKVCRQPKYTFKRDGIVVNRDCWDGQKVFCMQQYPRAQAMFVSEEGMRLLQERGFSNIELTLAGEIA